MKATLKVEFLFAQRNSALVKRYEKWEYLIPVLVSVTPLSTIVPLAWLNKNCIMPRQIVGCFCTLCNKLVLLNLLYVLQSNCDVSIMMFNIVMLLLVHCVV